MKDKKKTNNKGGFYIALCGCAVLVALMSYVGNIIGNNRKVPDDNEEIVFEIPETDESEELPVVGVEEDAEYDLVIVEPEPEPTPEPEVQETAKKLTVSEFLPAIPAPGKVIAEFSKKTPVYYEKLGDWRNHNGIDIEAEVGDDVYICEDGVVEKIYKNSLGGCILVDHRNGYKSLYANLGEVNLVAEGDELFTGETIGRVGEPSLGDLSNVPHLHFDLYYEGKAIDPFSKIKID